MKKSSLLVIIFVLLLSQFGGLPVYAATEGDFDYNVNSDGSTVTITGYSETAPKDVVIPGTLGGHPVTVIGDTAFLSSGLRSVTIPVGVTSIGDYAFESNQLESVEIPGSVTSIGTAAFYESGLRSVTIQPGVTSIGEEAFGDNKLEEVRIPGGVTSIGAKAFAYNQLSKVEFEGTPSIGQDSFSFQTKNSFDILGWFIDENFSIPWTGEVLGPMTIYAKWTQQAIPPMIYYVKENGAGNNDGSSWANAFASLQAALDIAIAGDEIWIGKGTYYPKEVNQGDPRTATFQMKNGVTIYGGFAGDSDSETVASRDWKANETILSGDLGMKDDLSDNAYHVFYHPSGTVNNTAVLDGVSIVGGNANGTATHQKLGGGMSNDNSHPKLTNVTLSGNTATNGGGMFNDSSHPVLTNVTLSGNTATNGGGGMSNNSGSHPVLTNVTLSGNTAAHDGGGMYNDNGSHPELTNVTLSGNTASSNAGGGMYNYRGSRPELTNVTLSDNTATNGGGIFNDSSHPVLTNVTLSGNTAQGGGGGMYNNNGSHPELTNVTLSGNTATTHGGGMLNSTSRPVLTKVTLSGNTADREGGGMYNSDSHPVLTKVTLSGNTAAEGGGMSNYLDSRPIVDNSIIWGNASSIYNTRRGEPTFTNSIIEGSGGSGNTEWVASFGEDKGGNLDEDPRFVDQKKFADAPTLEGDYRLLPGSPAIVSPEIMGALGIYEFAIDEVEVLTGITVQKGMVQADIPLPSKVNVTDDEGITIPLAVVWDKGTPAYDGNTLGSYAFTGTLDLLDHVTNPKGVTAKVSVIVGATGVPETKHTVTFDPNGGLGGLVEQEVVEGGNAVKPTPPTKGKGTPDEHTFVGWYEDLHSEVEWNFDSNDVTKDTTLYAKWTPFTYRDDPSGSGVEITGYASTAPKDVEIPSTLGGNPVTAIGNNAFFSNQLSSVTISGSVKTIGNYVFFGNNLTKVTIPANIKSIGNYAFLGNDLEAVIFEGTPTLGATPFQGYDDRDDWYIDQDVNNPWGGNVPEPMTIYIGYKYGVTFNTNGGSSVESEKVTPGAKATKPVNPTKAGHTFAGWYEESSFITEWNFNNPVIQNMTLYAKWKKNPSGGGGDTIPTYTLTFDANGGSAVATQNLTHNEKAVNPTAPTKAGHTFDGWYEETDFTTEWDFGAGIVKNTTLYAKWTPNSYTLTFESNEGSAVETQSIDYKKLAKNPTPPTKENHTFEGWYMEKEFKTKWSFEKDVITKNTTLYAKWDKNTVTPSHTLSFETNGGTTVAKQSVADNKLAKNPTPPTKENYLFEGWYTEKEFKTKWDFTKDVIIKNTTLYAKWTSNTYTLTFESNEGSVVEAQSIAYNKLATNPTVPTKAGYTFEGWYTEKEFKTQWDFEKDVVSENTTLYAKWTVNSSSGGSSGGGSSGSSGGGSYTTYTVTFNINEGSTVATQTLGYNKKVVNPTAPTKEGYTFAGWYKEADFTTVWDFEKDVVKGNTTLYAKWTENAPSCTADFSDIATHWAKEDIDAIACLDIIKGYPDGTFRPRESIKREHVALMFTRAFELTPIRSEISFTDVPADHRYYEAITEVYQAGIFDGASNDAFNPTAHMTRAQMAKVLVLAFDLESSEPSKNVFKDVPETHWAKDYIAILADNGIALGDDGDFKPSDPVTRAQFVAFMHRALNL